MARTTTARKTRRMKAFARALTCDGRPALCCRYTAVATHTPRERLDYELIRWYLVHSGISVYIDEGEWHVYVEARCRYLSSAHRCSMYSRRPTICAEYGTHECERHTDEADPDISFDTVEEFERYFRKNFRFWGDRIVRKAKPSKKTGASARTKTGKRRKTPAASKRQKRGSGSRKAKS